MNLTPQFIALGSAISYAASNLSARSGLRFSTPMTMTLVSLIVQTVVLWAAVFATGGIPCVPATALLAVVVVGAFMPLIRLLTYTGIAKIGASRAAGPRSTHPLFSALIAISLLNEEASPDILLGTVLVVGGIVTISRQREASVSPANQWHILYPLGGAFLAGVVHPGVRYALSLANEPLFFAAVVGLVSLVCFAGYLWSANNLQKLLWHSRALKPFLTAGCFETLGFLLFSAALNVGPVVLVSPIIATTPMWVLFGSIILLREVEKVTLRTSLGTATVVAGTVLLTA